MQLDIVQTMVNTVAKHIVCLVLCGCMTATVAANMLIVRLNDIQARPLFGAHCILVSCSIVNGWRICRILVAKRNRAQNHARQEHAPRKSISSSKV